MAAITSNMVSEFQGPYRLFSNFEGPQVKFLDFWYPKVEHAYQAGKTLDPALRVQFRNPTLKAGEAKRMGRTLAIRSDWDDVRLKHMNMLVRQKALDRQVLELLLSTEDELQEGNYWHDNFWGNCLCTKCKDIPGENHLGKTWMRIRQELWNFRVIFQ